MDDATAAALNAINLDFYRGSAGEFSAARQRPWRGWDRLAELLRERGAAALDVLDAGCGNARFGAFLADEGLPVRSYLGLDASPELLAHARARGLAGAEYRVCDLVASDPDLALPGAAFSLVTLFGVLHHVPGRERREALLRALLRRAAPGGLLVFSVWLAPGAGRGEARTIPWSEWRDGAIDPSRVEPGDCLLAWGAGRSRARYFHLADEREIAGLASGLGASPVAEWTSEDGGSWPNRYLALAPS